MAEFILVNGQSGSGKSTAANTLNPEKTVIICPENKILPFAGAKVKYKTIIDKDGNIDMKKSNFLPINKVMQPNPGKRATDPGVFETLEYIDEQRPEIKVVLIDTFTYAMVESVMRDINVDNYKKFNVFAQEFYDLVKMIPKLRNDLFVIMTAHVDEETDFSGVRRTGFKVPAGKLTKQMLVPEGLFTVVLFSESTVLDGKPIFYFSTVNSGFNTCKSPAGMFPGNFIPNNYRFVMDCYYAYYYDKEQPKLPENWPLKQNNNI
ncbi:MAG: AAA family ATPase [Parachlamydiales bacterium]|jgi:hypothetical protein